MLSPRHHPQRHSARASIAAALGAPEHGADARPATTASTPAAVDARAAAATATPSSRLRRAWLFVRGFLRHPLSVGTAFQSSPALVRRLAAGSPWGSFRHVVELGPGVGTVTTALLRELPADARLVAIESEPAFVEELRNTLADARLQAVHASAAELDLVLRQLGLQRVDAVISGIPFSTLARATREQIVRAVAAALQPGGEFIVYQHSALMLPLLRANFAEVSAATEWRNPVPMRVFRCRQPIAARQGQAHGERLPDRDAA